MIYFLKSDRGDFSWSTWIFVFLLSFVSISRFTLHIQHVIEEFNFFSQAGIYGAEELNDRWMSDPSPWQRDEDLMLHSGRSSRDTPNPAL